MALKVFSQTVSISAIVISMAAYTVVAQYVYSPSAHTGTYSGVPSTYASVPSTYASVPSTYASVPSTYASVPSTYASVPSTYSSVPSTYASVPSTYASVPSTYASVPSTYASVPSTYSASVPSTYHVGVPSTYHVGVQSHAAFLMRALVQTDVKNCTDLSCRQEQCCVETPRAKVCVEMTIVNSTTGERACQRYKNCKNDMDCGSGSCCVYNPYVTADATCPPPPDPYKYAPHSTPGQVVLPPKGVCMPMANAVNATCILSITNQNNCPCGMASGLPLVCNAVLGGSIVGTCGTT